MKVNEKKTWICGNPKTKTTARTHPSQLHAEVMTEGRLGSQGDRGAGVTGNGERNREWWHRVTGGQRHRS